MQKKLFLSLLLLIGSVASVSAQTALVVMQKSGGSMYYSFNDNPKAMFSGDNLIISTSKTVVEYPIANLFSFSFDEMANGILDINTNGANVKLTDNMIVVTGLANNEIVSIVDAKGVKVASAKAENGVATISLGNLPNGVYMVKSKKVSYKIVRK